MADSSKDKSNSSSFEDLSNITDADLKEAATPSPAEPSAVATEDVTKPAADDVIDIIGTGQLLKKVKHTTESFDLE